MEHENVALLNLFTVKLATESDTKRIFPDVWTPFDDMVRADNFSPCPQNR